MAYRKTQGCVMQNISYRDANVLLKILTADYGLITCSVKDAKRKNSPFKIAVTPFVFAEYEFFYYKNRYQLQAADIIDRYAPLAEDLTRLTCISHLAELVLDILRHQNQLKEIYPFWAYASYQITHGPDPVLLTHLAQLKLLSDQGFSPWIHSCLICNRPIDLQGNRFYFAKGGIICQRNECRQHIGSSSIMDLQYKTLKTLDYLLQLSYAKCFNIPVTEEVRDEIITFSKRYTTFVMEKEYQKLDMIRSLEKFEKGIYE